MKQYLSCLIFLVATSLQAQENITQTIRGKVIDADGKYPLTGVTVLLVNDEAEDLVGTTTDLQGEFRLEQIPLGRHNLKFSFMGYKEVMLSNLILTSSKELILEVAMEEMAISLADVEVRATRTGEAQNEMAIVSARAFTVEETDRYAGSRGDPARMASNFAGVQGADDSRNDIVIRGNAPGSVLWQLEGINIPNPNHFGASGTSGGPVNIINNKILANSDFYTGAFPAEFGNTVSGVFDLKFRKGNNEKHERSFQLGFMGAELFLEGPLRKTSRSAFLVGYRYSSLQLFSALGIDVGTTAVPRYQDLAFKFNFPLKNKGNLSVFAVGGKSNIDIKVSEESTEDRNLYGEKDRDQYFGSRMAVMGISYEKVLKNQTYMKATLAGSQERVQAEHYYIVGRVQPDGFIRVQDLPAILGYNFTTNKYSQVLSFFKKIDNKNTLNYGFQNDIFGFNLMDSARQVSILPQNDPNAPLEYQSTAWLNRWNEDGTMAVLAQPYLQWKHKPNEALSLVMGLHQQYFSLTDSWSPFEPRLGINWKLDEMQNLNMGMGLHSQIQPAYTYFYKFTDQSRPDMGFQAFNREMDFTRSKHLVLGYERMLGNQIRMKWETYYQHLTRVPVENRASSFSLLNSGASFNRIFPEVGLVNEGTGENYGLELTLEKYYSKGYLFLVTGSLFEARYQGSDGIWRDTEFNGNYAFNFLGTREFQTRNGLIGIGTNITTAGGRRYGPVDVERTQEQQEIIYQDESRNSLRFDPYFRMDLRVNYRINRKKLSHEIALDLINILNTKNILNLTWAPDELENPDPEKSIIQNYQLGFLPIFYYKVDF
ncbi:carboxypeptidase-like regulatory domain-containing protein [Cyclobacterium sp.]|uniref:carboxypeptidase-like regulatory domain-containing protein n=1 Tax=Cyclobacterium sp. TaxID=1966343 RepID=UPI00198B965D|nr:carboxypeptidase-like regulatory domain-containing protein [Cyclobacterium sp.]MBD3627456.1 TonB-dependent receptor [Cyclobacterium sp.]